MHRIFVFLGLLAIWLLFSGLYDFFHVSLGLLSCAFVTHISHDLLFADRSTSLRTRSRQAYRLCGYLLWLLLQVILSNVHLLRLALTPRGIRDVSPSIVRVKTPLKSDFEKFMLCNSITLTPGTTTIRIEGDTLYIHAISQTTVRGLTGEMDRRIAHIFAAPPTEDKS